MLYFSSSEYIITGYTGEESPLEIIDVTANYLPVFYFNSYNVIFDISIVVIFSSATYNIFSKLSELYFSVNNYLNLLTGLPNI